MATYWRQWCSLRAQDQHRLGVAALEAEDVVRALLHLRAAVRFDCHIQHRAATASIYERGARLWYESAELRDEIRRREELARGPGRWLYELTPFECGLDRVIGGDTVEAVVAARNTGKDATPEVEIQVELDAEQARRDVLDAERDLVEGPVDSRTPKRRCRFMDVTEANLAAGIVGFGMTGIIAPPGTPTAEARARASEKPKRPLVSEPRDTKKGNDDE